MKTLISKIVAIQGELKAPKNQYNSFGKYKYRSCEDILEALKPLLVKEGLLLTITDDIVMVGDRVYVKATVSVTDGEHTATNCAFAREEDTKKGMDGSQVTGASSSYARKYALNGMFCIDDTKDADATNTHGKGNAEKPTDDNPLLDMALSDVRNAKTKKELLAVYESYQALQTNAKFTSACTTRKEQLKSA
jgi:hypothetical protein